MFTVRLRFGYAHLPPEQVNNESLPVAQSVYVADPYSSVYAPLIVYADTCHSTGGQTAVRRQVPGASLSDRQSGAPRQVLGCWSWTTTQTWCVPFIYAQYVR